ncbi:MAG: RNA polymerase sigma factor [Clostridiaceae bacterium]|nr:RNA polymerase sigma factor [Clostridiaceae bacterium]
MANLKIKKVHDKNIQQFNDLILPLYNEFYKFIYSILRNKTLTDDVGQNSLLIALVKLDTLHNFSKSRSWLFTIGKREAMRLLKTYQREVAYTSEVVDIIQYPIEVPDDIVIENEKKEKLLNLINELPDNYRDLILLRYYKQLSFREAAVILNQNYSTIRTWHKRAKKNISDKLKI